MTTRTETLKLIISGDGRLLGTELNKSEKQVTSWGGRLGGVFSGINNKIASSVKRIATNPLTIVGGTAGFMYAGKMLIDYQSALSTIGINAGKTAAEILSLDQALNKTALDVGQDRDDLVSAMSDIIDKTGDYEFAAESMHNVGRASTAMSAEVMDSGRVLSALRLGMNATAEEAEEYFDIMARMGNIGSFTFAQQASQAERLFSSAALAVGIQKKNFAEYNAFMQTVKPMFGSADMAGTAIESIMNKLKTDGSKIQKKLGFRLFDEKGAIIDFERTIKAIAKLSPSQRSKMFGEYSKAFTIFDSEKGLTDFERYIETGRQAGFISEAFARKQQDAKVQLSTLTTIAKTFSGTALVPTLDSLTKGLRSITQDPEKIKQVADNIEILATAFGGLAKWLVIKPAEGWAEILGVVTEPFSDRGRQRTQLSKQARAAFRALSKEDQELLRPMISNNNWNTSTYEVLRRWRPEALGLQNDSALVQTPKIEQKITVVAPEGTKVLSETRTPVNMKTQVNRGSFR